MRLTKARPLFWPLPPKLKPCTLKTAFTASCSFSRKCRSSFSIDCIVRSCVAPTGAITWLSRYPWSSAGRNELGRRVNSTAMTTTSAAKIAMKRPLRARMPRTPDRYAELPFSNVRLNQPKKPRSAWCSPFCSGFNIVAHRAGVSTIATSTDRAIADTIVAENCR